jgi:hypothetical protein
MSHQRGLAGMVCDRRVGSGDSPTQGQCWLLTERQFGHETGMNKYVGRCLVVVAAGGNELTVRLGNPVR